MLPALQAQRSAMLSFTPADRKGCFHVVLCVRYYWTKPGIWNDLTFFVFIFICCGKTGVLHAFLTWDMSFSILLGKVRRQTWQEPCSPGSLQAEDAPHLQGQGTSGSRRQHHLGCVREQKQLWSGSGFSDGLLKAAHKRTGFQTFPVELVSAAAKGVAAACAGLPALN